MPVELAIAIFVGLLLFILQRPKPTEDPNYQKHVAFHEAAHAIMGIHCGFRCKGVILNVTAGKPEIIRPEYADIHGTALIDTAPFHNEFDLIKNSMIINLNRDALPRDEGTIQFAKKQLLILYAGDLIVQKVFNVPNYYLGTNSKGYTQQGEDLNVIQNIHDYLEKVDQAWPPEEAKQAVHDIYDQYKEVRAAIHFLADRMLKNPGVMISEVEIIEDLKTVNFFKSAAKSGEDNSELATD